MRNKLFGLILIIIGTFIFTGCSIKASYSTIASLDTTKKDRANVYVDQDSTSLGFLNSSGVLRTNLKYALATAAQTTIDNGYRYFSIETPTSVKKLFKKRKANTAKKAYDICDEGEGSFSWGLSYTPMVSNRNVCDALSGTRKENTLFGGTVLHRSIRFSILMTNEKISDYNIFDAKEVLASKEVADLDKAYFVNNKR